MKPVRRSYTIPVREDGSAHSEDAVSVPQCRHGAEINQGWIGTTYGGVIKCRCCGSEFPWDGHGFNCSPATPRPVKCYDCVDVGKSHEMQAAVDAGYAQTSDLRRYKRTKDGPEYLQQRFENGRESLWIEVPIFRQD